MPSASSQPAGLPSTAAAAPDRDETAEILPPNAAAPKPRRSLLRPAFLLRVKGSRPLPSTRKCIIRAGAGVFGPTISFVYAPDRSGVPKARCVALRLDERPDFCRLLVCCPRAVRITAILRVGVAKHREELARRAPLAQAATNRTHVT